VKHPRSSKARHWTGVRKAGYASVETGVTAFELMLQVFLLEFYVREYGLDPLLASAGAAIAVLWDAVTDPLVGMLSDRQSEGKFGKRGRYVLLGSIALGLSGIALFHPPAQASQWSLMIWYLGSYLAVNTSMSFVSVPHIACVGDYASSSSERNSFFGWRLLASNIGLLLGVTLPSQLGDASGAGGREQASICFAGILVVCALLFIRSTYKVPIAGTANPTNPATLKSFARDLVRVFRNRLFVNLVIAFALAAVARAVNAGLALFYYKDVLKLDEKTDVAVILSVFILAIIASIPLWLALGKRFWKKRPAVYGVLLLGIASCLSYPFFPAGQLTGPLIMAIIGGIAVGSVLLIESMVLDTIDMESNGTGNRKDGVYFGCWKLTAKCARAMGVLLTGPLLVWTGYDASQPAQSAVTTERLADLFGFVVGGIFIASALVLARNKLKPNNV
jgi:Na+/melibiose symporter-like transporter